MSEKEKGWFLAERIFFYVVAVFSFVVIYLAVDTVALIVKKNNEKSFYARDQDHLGSGVGTKKKLPDSLTQATEVSDFVELPAVKYDNEKELPDFIKTDETELMKELKDLKK